jgi:hypothetical protein
MKQFTAWRVRQLDGGILEWTSPLGRTYTEHPPVLGVHFRASADDPPVDGPLADRSDPPPDADPAADAPF